MSVRITSYSLSTIPFSPLACARGFVLLKGGLVKEVLLYPSWALLMHKVENHMAKKKDKQNYSEAKSQ